MRVSTIRARSRYGSRTSTSSVSSLSGSGCETSTPKRAPTPIAFLNTVNDKYIELLAHGVAGELGGGIGIAPRVFLRKLVDVMDKVDEHADFDPRRDYALTVSDGELTLEEREARRPRTADDVALDV